MEEFEKAKDKIMMGAERKSMVMSDKERLNTAYHEAGHAIVTINEKAAYPIHKATIIPRGRALGMVMRLPERDQLSESHELLAGDSPKSCINVAVTVFGAAEFQDHHPFLFLITVFGKCLPKALRSRVDRSGMFFRQECLVITTSQKKDSSH